MRKLTNVFFALFFIFAASSLYAASQDVVYLKNGTIIRGVIVEEIPNVTIKIETKDGSVFVFQMSEVIKIEKEKEAAAPTAGAEAKNNPEKNLAILINPLGFVQFGPQLDLEVKLIPNLYLIGVFRIHSLGMISHMITDSMKSGYAFGGGLRKFFRNPVTANAFYIGEQEQYGIIYRGNDNYTGTSTYIASAFDAGYRWRLQGFLFSLGILAGIAPALTDTWHYYSDNITHNNPLKTYFFGMLEIEVGFEI